MCRALVVVLALSLLAAAVSAQPQDGDLVVSTFGFTAYFHPSSPGTVATFAAARTGHFHAGVRMAPNNRDLVVAEGNASTNPWTGDLVSLSWPGGRTTIAAGIAGKTFALDHDDRWIIAYHQAPVAGRSTLWGVKHQGGSAVVYSTLHAAFAFNGTAIDRDPGVGMPYIVPCFWASSGKCADVIRMDRLGGITTLSSGTVNPGYSCIAVHPRSGDYLIGSWMPASPLANLVRMTKTGKITTLVSKGTMKVNALQVTQDDTLWCTGIGYTNPMLRILKYDLVKGAVVTMLQTGLPGGILPLGIEVYGSRTLVCNRTSPATVAIRVQSRHRFTTPGKTQYALAASFARRPGLRLPHGEWLDLNTVSDPLFFATAANQLPTIFQNFRGVLGAGGDATAAVHVPLALRGSGIAVFVAGVIYNSGGAFQATNSHWIVL